MEVNSYAFREEYLFLECEIYLNTKIETSIFFKIN